MMTAASMNNLLTQHQNLTKCAGSNALDANLIVYKEYNGSTATEVYKVSAANQLMDIIDVNIDLPCYNIHVSDNIIRIFDRNATPDIQCVITCKNSDDADQYYHSLFTRQQRFQQLKG